MPFLLPHHWSSSPWSQDQFQRSIFMTHTTHLTLSAWVHHGICVPFAVKALLNGYAKSQNSQRAAQWLECMEANDIKPSISAHLSPAMYPMMEDESHLPEIFEFKRLTDLIVVRSLFRGGWCFVLLMNQATSGRGWLAERQGETPHAWHVQSQSCWVTKVQLRVLSE